jgi:RNA-binding protein YlmH
VVAATWQVERIGTVDRYRGVLGTREHSERVDVIVAASIPALSRAKVQRLIEDRRVRVAGQVIARSNQRLRTGDVIELDVELSVVN